MKTIKIKFEIPTEAELLAGLSPHDLHKKLARAEAAADALHQELATARTNLEQHERDVAAMPAKIRQGSVPADALTDAMYARDAAALATAPIEVELGRALARVDEETAIAKAKRAKELEKRVDSIAAIAAQLAPVCEILGDLDFALAQQEDRSFRCTGKISWPTCIEAELAAESRAFGMAENERARASAPKRY